jgi:hypothetical protein
VRDIATFEERRKAEALKAKHDDGTYPEGFFLWVVVNWHIYDAFCRKVHEAIKHGSRKWSARSIVEILRWDSEVTQQGGSFKINDHVVPGLARLAMARNPNSLAGYFETRTPPGKDKAEKLDGRGYPEGPAAYT